MTTVGPRLVFIQRFLRSMKDVCITKSMNTLTKFFLNINGENRRQVCKTQHCDDG